MGILDDDIIFFLSYVANIWCLRKYVDKLNIYHFFWKIWFFRDLIDFFVCLYIKYNIIWWCEREIFSDHYWRCPWSVLTLYIIVNFWMTRKICSHSNPFLCDNLQITREITTLKRPCVIGQVCNFFFSTCNHVETCLL